MIGRILLGFFALAVWPVVAQADVVLDWNETLRDVIKSVPAKANPGLSTRAIAMTNGAIYDVFQAINRTHAPYMVNASAPGASLDAAVIQAAYLTLSDCYGAEQQSMLDTLRTDRLAALGDSPAAIAAGLNLGNLVGQHYAAQRSTDGFDLPGSYSVTNAPGRWSSDPTQLNEQSAWGPAWGDVTTWAMSSNAQFDGLMNLPSLDSQQYVDAFNQVKDYGAIDSAVRTQEQTEIGIFWAYDRPGMGPPPVLFLRNLEEVSLQVGNSPAENARLFAMASVAMADAAVASWHVKFATDFWRPITAIRAGENDDDDNPATVEDPNWVPLAAPGDDPNSSTDDFTPPFPAYTSGHATMGGALFKTLELFYGTNNFDEIDGILGNNSFYTLSSEEAGSGGPRDYSRFTQVAPLTVGTEDSPEGENAISRIYLGIHWLFDGTDGILLGNSIADYVAGNHFQAVPEPSAAALGLLALFAGGLCRRPRAAISRRPQTDS